MRSVQTARGTLTASLEPAPGVAPLDELLGRIAEAALELFANADPSHIRKCARPECVLYFLDTTKNHRRQWCSMAGCGNRAKASRFRKRRDPAARPPTQP